MLGLARLLCIAVLAWGVTPGLGELVENTWHLATRGHIAHAAGAEGDHHAPSGSEHGCTGAFHLCGCHASAHFTPPSRPALAAVSPARRAAARNAVALRDGVHGGIERPPRA